MSRFGSRDLSLEAEPEDDYDPAVDCWCQYCGVQFNGSDSSGGHCKATFGGPNRCCQSFSSFSGFERHQVATSTPGHKRCLTPDEMRAKGWTVDDSKVWRLPAPKNSPWKRENS